LEARHEDRPWRTARQTRARIAAKAIEAESAITEVELETIEVGLATIEATEEIEAAVRVTAVETVEAEAVIASATKARHAQADLEG